MKNYFILIIKGTAMGAANVIPGVSGGTMALITGIFERLINSIKSFNLKALRLVLGGKIKEFIKYTDLWFLVSVFTGIVLAIITLAKIFDYLFVNYPVYIWAYFFGLVAASIYFVGKTVKKWQSSVILTFVFGATIAVIISLLNPATENRNFIYLIICGIVAICSMILPGLSGSFVLILLGNYQLIAIEAINAKDFSILFPVLIGAVVGLVAFSHFLSWIFKKFRDQTISLLTGFILGSLSVLWPWQKMKYMAAEDGTILEQYGQPIAEKFINYLPESLNLEVIYAIALMVAGIISIWLIEKAAKIKSPE
ncbi:MAG: DUF368 domain-containing protein [Bacteroidales bacterium]|nr:DUF368 domain-containing protein [Bacteroidales bacterium]